ncbi:MAG TPA: metallophosphoesterase family protein [Polyangiaceae bacterium]|jgi:serine/threonine protein phosphatase 1|nr:MAG: diadenosine tetraphosphatase [Deltaproteobacteria bacterium ADurb.Bin207]HNS96232.1 metallophosphoesterase family protein [Polyangiaceae bacterium]HNZ20824.1 metallophosphoesterase family protein [Polyangiaceae bacterium]HOD22644.1 metallophosphoesterase family protein [Polyangiaceae bacterium]HOE48254.1 metallophosphoesterase family protein [Polyangiaceae bacterium]
MAGRTFAVGDLHGGLDQLFRLLSCFPELDAEDTLVFIGDYVDRGPKSAQVVDYIRNLPSMTRANVVALRGNHEDAWLRVVDHGWDEFVMPPLNGCLAAFRSFVDGPVPSENELPRADERMMIQTGAFFPDDVVQWFRQLPLWYEDEHAIYVHAGLPQHPDGGFYHPRQVTDSMSLLWGRDEEFFSNYTGKLVVFGHTGTEYLAQEIPKGVMNDQIGIWRCGDAIGIDTGCGHGGYLSALELPAMNIYDSR